MGMFYGCWWADKYGWFCRLAGCLLGWLMSGLVRVSLRWGFGELMGWLISLVV